MCYLIAKKFDQPGCIAVEASRGKALAKTVTELSKLTSEKGVQILTVSSMDAYGEYKPYNVLHSQAEFINRALAM